ncbi:hypothetical protein sos41_28830 [Alphaproteobacteria bacterium SO-S41]|nr:hypothetical protein sos41_28830 [Alphaproteobacteria bacterium SO-S41]
MALKSRLFAGNKALEAAAKDNAAHIVPGATGEHVSKIQGALQALDNARIVTAELARRNYGPSTAAAVLAYKTKRNIINRSYQQSADNVTGIMTLARMDEELAAVEMPIAYVPTPIACGRPNCTCGAATGQYEPAMPMSDAAMIAVLERSRSPGSQAALAALGGKADPNRPVVASAMRPLPGPLAAFRRV